MGASEPPPGAYTAVPAGPPPPPGAHSGPSYGPPPGGPPGPKSGPGAYPPGAYPPGPPGPGGAPPPYPPGAYPPPGSYPPGAYPPAPGPAPGHPVPGHGTTTTVMYMQHPPQALPSYWPPMSQTIVCPFCSQTVITQVSKNVGLGTWLIAGGLAFVGCIFGCCLIPFCVDSCKDTVHMCPSCNRMVGVAKLV